MNAIALVLPPLFVEATIWRWAFYPRLAGVGLTTIRAPSSESGRLAAKLLIERIANPNKEQEIHILETELICRESCCPLKGEENI